MQKESSISSFLPGVVAIIALIVIGSIIILLTQNKKQDTSLQNENIVPSEIFTATPTLQVQNTKPPENDKQNQIPLTIIEPKANIIVAVSAFTIRGKTAPYAEVSVNDQTITADNQGDFSYKVTLEEGDNYFNITVNDEDGNFNEQEITITYQI